MEEVGGAFFTGLVFLLIISLMVEGLKWLLGVLLGWLLAMWPVLLVLTVGYALARVGRRPVREWRESRAVVRAEAQLRIEIRADFDRAERAMRRAVGLPPDSRGDHHK